MAGDGRITTCLWFDTQAQEAAELYTSLIPGSRILRVTRNPDGPRAGEVVFVEFELAGTRFALLNGGPMFPQSEAASIMVECADQAEVDRLWAALTADGGTESECGWLKDRFGVSWQIVPAGLVDMIAHPDRERAGRAWNAMMTMGKLDIAAIRAAFEGT